MPVIFNDENMDLVREEMLKNGFELLVTKGVTGMTVAEVAKVSGYAKGTFYTFFPSKEEFIYQIIVNRREQIKEKYIELFEKYGPLDKNQLLNFFHFLQDSQLNVYQYLSEKDLDYLSKRWPKEYNFSPEADEKITKWLLGNLKGIKRDVDWRVVANMMKTIVFVNMKKDILHDEALEATVNVLWKAIIDYIYGGN